MYIQHVILLHKCITLIPQCAMYWTSWFLMVTQGQEQTKCWAAVQKAIVNTITNLQNCTLEHYREMALGKITG